MTYPLMSDPVEGLSHVTNGMLWEFINHSPLNTRGVDYQEYWNAVAVGCDSNIYGDAWFEDMYNRACKIWSMPGALI